MGERIQRSRQFSTGGLYSRGTVRTRGYIPTTPPEEEAGAGGPVRNRGAVHVSGAPAGEATPWRELGPEELVELLQKLREVQDRFPLTLAVDDMQTADVEALLACLQEENLLEADDALWILGEGEYEKVVPEAMQKVVSRGAYLNVRDEEQQTLAEALIPDLVFVTDEDAMKLKERLKKWERRAWAVVVMAPEDFDPETLSDLKLGHESKPEWLRRWPV